MDKNWYHTLITPLLFAVVLLVLSGCGSLHKEQTPRFFWPPPPGEAKIEYLNFYFSDEDLKRGVDRRLEDAILGRRQPERIVETPYSVASDGKGRIIVGDFADKRVKILDRPNHTSRMLLEVKGAPQKVLVDKVGEIWILDGINAIVYRFAADEILIDELKIKGVERAASLAVDSERQLLYLSDGPNHRIRVYDYQGQLLRSIGERGRNVGQFNFPADLALDTAGNLYVVDSMNARIQVVSPEGVFIRNFGERGTSRGSFSMAKGIAVSPADLVYITDVNQNKVVIFNTRGDFLLTLGGRYVYEGSNIQPGGFNFPAGVAADANETIFIADFFNGMIHEFQYLTPEFLARRPIRAEQVYNPQSGDLNPIGQGEAPRPLPATPPGGAEQSSPAFMPLQMDKR